MSVGRPTVDGARLISRLTELRSVGATATGGVTREAFGPLDVEARALVRSWMDHAGLTTRSACGHTMRNVMASEDAGLGLDEPFDCLPDARAVSDAILARSAVLNRELPSRVNIAFGGSPNVP